MMLQIIITHKINNVSKTYCNSNGDITLNKTSNNYPNDTYNIIKANYTFNPTDNNYYNKKNFNTSNITNNITIHNQSNYEHNVIKHVHRHINIIHNYGTEINYYYKISLNKKQYCNFHHGNFNFRKLGTSH